MSKTLYLMRHAHCPSAPDLPDKQRPLSTTGHDQATFIGRLCAAHGYRPSVILCSSAVRTRETLAGVSAAAQFETPQTDIHYSDALYSGTTGTYLELLQTLPNHHSSAMLIGHNPIIPALVTCLANEKQSDDALYKSLISYYMPATLTQIECPIENWADLSPYKNALLTVNQPEPAA